MANHVHVADIDTELQRSRCHHHGVRPELELLFDFQPRLTREAAMMRSDFAFAQPLAQLVRHALDQTARIDEYQCRPVRLDLLDELIEYGRPDILANNRAELLIRHFDAQIHLAPVANVDIEQFGVPSERMCCDPTSSRPTSSMGFCVALKPMRCNDRPARASRRSSESARWAPRLSCATA